MLAKLHRRISTKKTYYITNLEMSLLRGIQISMNGGEVLAGVVNNNLIPTVHIAFLNMSSYIKPMMILASLS